MEPWCEQVIETLGLNIERLWQQLPITVDDRPMVCQLLLGRSRQEVAMQAIAHSRNCSESSIQDDLERIRRIIKDRTQTSKASTKTVKTHLQAWLSDVDYELYEQFERTEQRIRDRLSTKIYPAIAELMNVPQESISGNWVRILNFLYTPHHGYRLSPPPELNSDNFQGSLGRQVFSYPPDRAVATEQIEGTQFYQRGLYYQAMNAFVTAWKREKDSYNTGNPEILIYINNCLVDYYGDRLKDRGVEIYTLAVVVPFHHNQGLVAAEVLRGIAQLQWQTNLQGLYHARLDRELDAHALPIGIPDGKVALGHPVVLRIMVVNDPNNVYDAYNQTAEKLAAIAPELKIIAILGHYSSEMTERALRFYALGGLALLNASSTANGLSNLPSGEQQSFFRLTTPDRVNAVVLMDYLAKRAAQEGLSGRPQRVVLVYNKNSQYCLSYQATIRNYIAAHTDRFTLLAAYDRLGDRPRQVYLTMTAIASQDADVIVVIPDGGIEPNSLHNVGLISRFNLKAGLIAGSATLYQQNVLHWMDERFRPSASDRSTAVIDSRIAACIPWHWHSSINGCQGANPLGQQFCAVGQALWGSQELTWRSATAFDALLVVLDILRWHRCATGEDVLVHLHQEFKIQRKSLNGVTGLIQFDKQGDRLNPPAEMVTVTFDAEQQQWCWVQAQ